MTTYKIIDYLLEQDLLRVTLEITSTVVFTEVVVFTREEIDLLTSIEEWEAVVTSKVQARLTKELKILMATDWVKAHLNQEIPIA